MSHIHRHERWQNCVSLWTWVMSHTRIIYVSYTIMNNSLKRDMDELCHVSHTNNCIWDMNYSCLICKWAKTWMNWVMSHTRIIVCETRIIHVSYTNEPRPTHERVMSHIHRHERWQNYVSILNWVIFHTRIICVSHANEPRPTHEQAKSHTWTSHVPHMNKSSPTSTGMSGGKISKHVAFDQQVNKNNSFFSKISFKSKM